MWDCFRSHERLKAEILILRHQLNILHRKAPKRLRLSGGDRALFVWLYRSFPDIGNATAIVRPETIIRWHRMGFRAWWRWKSHNPGGRPGIDQEPRDLVRRMCKENPLWGAPRIHGELLKLGFDVAQSTVSKYTLRRRGPPSQGWKTFLRNHADGIASVDFLIVPTLAFERLFVFVILGLGRRRLLWASRPIRRRNGWPARLPKPFLGTLFRAFSSVTMMVPMARRSLDGFEQWAFAIAPSRPDHHGRMDMSNVRSGRSVVNASTM